MLRQSIEKLRLVRTLMAAPIPDDEGVGVLIISSGIGVRNLYLCEIFRGSE